MRVFNGSGSAEPGKVNQHKPLGDLEQAVMEVLWQHGTLGSPEVQAALMPARPLALTTVVTTLDRLHKKGILRRERVGKGYQYSPAINRSKLEQQIVREVLENLMTEFPDALTSLLSEGSTLPPALHDRLSVWLQRQREEKRDA